MGASVAFSEEEGGAETRAWLVCRRTRKEAERLEPGEGQLSGEAEGMGRGLGATGGSHVAPGRISSPQDLEFLSVSSQMSPCLEQHLATGRY